MSLPPRRIRVAGGRFEEIFHPSALELIYHYSQGIVRLINLLCEGALINAFCDDEKSVTASNVENAAHELDLCLNELSNCQTRVSSS